MGIFVVNLSFLMVRHKTLLECEISLVFRSDSFWGRSQKFREFLSNLCAWNKNLELKTSNNDEKKEGEKDDSSR